MHFLHSSLQCIVFCDISWPWNEISGTATVKQKNYPNSKIQSSIWFNSKDVVKSQCIAAHPVWHQLLCSWQCFESFPLFGIELFDWPHLELSVVESHKAVWKDRKRVNGESKRAKSSNICTVRLYLSWQS